MSWAICLITDVRGSCLIYEPVGSVPEPVQRLRHVQLGRLLAAVAEFANGGAVATTIASVPINAWRSPRGVVVSILNASVPDSVLPKMITTRLEAVLVQTDVHRDEYTVHSAVTEPTERVETVPELKEFAETVVRPLVATYLGRNLLDVFAIDSVIQCELVDDGFTATLYRLDEIDPRRRTVIGRHNTALWSEIKSAVVAGDDPIVTVTASETITAVICKPDVVIFTVAPVRKDVDGIRALTPDLQSAIAEWTRIQTTNPSEPGWAQVPRPPAAAPPSERRSRDLRHGPDRSSAPVRRRSSADAAFSSTPLTTTTTPGEIDSNKGRSQS